MQITTIINESGLTIPPNITQDEWVALHRHIIQAKRQAGKWLKVSREFGTERYGLDFVAETEVQMELALGIEYKDDSQNLNPRDKSRAIITIEGITGMFKLWQRKISDDIETWDRDKLKRALDLLEPIEKQAAEIRRRMNSQSPLERLP